MRNDGALRVASSAIGLYLAFVYRTMRWRRVGDPADFARLGREPVIVAFWHERLPLIPPIWAAVRRAGIVRGGPAAPHVLISRHRDGALIARVMARFGARTVHGSSGREKAGRRTDRGGAAAFRGLLAVLRGGDHVVITPDGPRGPAHVPQPGLALLAGVSGRPIVPVAAACRPALRLPGWDRMVLPLPFARGTMVVLPPLAVGRAAPDAALPAIAAALDEALRRAEAGR